MKPYNVFDTTGVKVKGKAAPVLNHLKTGFIPNIIYKSSLYLTGNTLRLH
jgi:hypothetical protein